MQHRKGRKRSAQGRTVVAVAYDPEVTNDCLLCSKEEKESRSARTRKGSQSGKGGGS